MENFEEQHKANLSFPITLPVTINAVSPTAFLPVTVTADSITATGQWSTLFPNLDPTVGPKILSLTLPTRLSFPATITVATNTFTAVASLTDKRTFFDIFANNGPRNRLIPPHSHHGYHHGLTSTQSITALPIILTFIFDHNNNNYNNNNNNKAKRENNNNNANNNNNNHNNNGNNNNINNNSNGNNNNINNNSNGNNNNNNSFEIHLTICENSITIDGHPLIESTVAIGKPSLAAVLLTANNAIPYLVED